MSPRRTRLVVLVSHPIQYFAPVFRLLAQREDLDFSVLFRTRVGVDSYYDAGFGRAVQWDIPLLDGYHSSFLSSKLHSRGIEWSVVGELIRCRPEVLLLHGYSHATNLLALIAARLLGSRILMRGDTRQSAHHEKSAFKPWLKRFLFRMVDGCISIGNENRKYYEGLGVPSSRIHFAPFSVDNARFDLGDLHFAVRREQRKKMGIPLEAKVVLSASKLVAQKRIADLLEAMKMIGASNEDAVLVIAGSGPAEGDLRSAVGEMDARIRFVGFRNQTEMPSLFAACDVFVLPSEAESWGLIVNEAMAAGLPVIVSDDVGAAWDLVDGMGTGLVYPVGDVVRLAVALEEVLGSEETRRRMARKSREVIQQWGVAESAEGIARAALSVAGHGADQ